MARFRRKKARRGGKSHKVSITGAAPLLYLGVEMYNGYKHNGVQGVMDNGLGRTTGFAPSTGKWDGASLIPMASILLSGYVIRKVANRVAPNAFMGLPIRW